MVKISGIVSFGKNLTKSISETAPARGSNPLRAVSFGGIVTSAATTSAVAAAKKLPESAKFYSYPESLQAALSEICENFRGSEKNKHLATFLDNLMINSSEHELIAKLIKNNTKFVQYVKSKSELNKLFKNVTAKDRQTREIILENLALMEVFNPNGFKALKESKGFKEILAGRLNIAYLSPAKPMKNIDENYFYKVFEELEKLQTKRLSAIEGLDKNLAEKLIKASDDKICENPEYLERILSQFEKSKNPELTNRILKTFEHEMEKSYTSVLNALEASNASPELAEKIIQLDGIWSGNMKFLLKNISRSRVISDDVLNYYINLNHSNPKMYPSFALNSVNSFLKNTGKDEALLKTVCEKVKPLKSSNFTIDDILFAVNENNVGYLKHNLSLGKLDDEVVTKLRLMKGKEAYKDSANWSEVDRVYNETYLPVRNSFSGRDNLTWHEQSAAHKLSEMRLYDAETFKQIEELGLVELIKNGRVNPRILTGFRDGSKFTPEVLADLKMLKNNESLIKKFDNFDKIFSKTKEGDVISVNGQLYLNLGGKIERWNMSEEKFNELFPLVDRFTAMQGHGDCYLITTMDALYRNPKSRGLYYKMFEQVGDDICVTIPAYKNFNGKVVFPKGEIKTAYNSCDGAKHVQMLEQTYSRTALRSESNYTGGKDPLTTDDLSYLADRIQGGHPEVVMKEFLTFNNNVRKGQLSRKIYTKGVSTPQDLEKFQKIMDTYGNNPRFIFNIATLNKGAASGHALQVRGYNPETKKLAIVDPNCNGVETEKTVDELKDELYNLYTTILA